MSVYFCLKNIDKMLSNNQKQIPFHYKTLRTEIHTNADTALKWQKQEHRYRLIRRIIIIAGVILACVVQHYLSG